MESHSSYPPQAQRLPVCEGEVREHKKAEASLQTTSVDVDMPQVGSCSFGQQSDDSAFNSSQFNQSASSQFDQLASSQFDQLASSQFDQSASSQFSQSTSSQFDQSASALSAIQATSSASPLASQSASSSFNAEPPASGQEADPHLIDCAQLAECLSHTDSSSPLYILIDSRSFIEYNSCHIQEALNVCCSKIIKRRLQNDKTTVRELLNNVNNGSHLDNASLIVVYDQASETVASLPEDSCLRVLWAKLAGSFKNVRFLKGGFNEFHRNYNALCTNKAQMLQCRQKKPTMEALSQPCLPNLGPTRILPFLYLGSQVDAMNQELLKSHNITYELNVSTTCPKPDFIQDSHFLRIPVNDNYSDKLLPYFPQAIHFLDKVRESSGCVLVHCLGGISRSATVAIAYIMQHMKMTSDDAYRYLKGKRATISPNFNFLGQLLEYEKQLIEHSILPAKTGENSLLKLSKERLEKGDHLADHYHLQPLTPLLADLNNKSFTSSSPKHHVLHQHFNPHLMSPANQEKRSGGSTGDSQTSASLPGDSPMSTGSADQIADPPADGSTASPIATTTPCSASQFATTANGAQKRTCSFSSSPQNTRNKMTLKLQVNENDGIGSVLFM